MNPPEFSSREAVEDFIAASRAAVRINPEGLEGLTPADATRWLAERWDLYYVPETQALVLANFMARRLSK